MSQIYKTNTSGAGGVASVTGINGVTVNPTSGDVVVSLTPPNSYIHVFDDFLASSSNAGLYDWEFETFSNVNGTSTNPGQANISGGAAGTILALTDSGQHGSFVVGGGTLTNNFVYDIGTLSDNTNTYVAYIGFTDSGVSSSFTLPTYGIYFQYTDTVNAGNWQIICNNGITSTVVNTAVTASIGFHNYGFVVNSAGTSVNFTIDAVSVGTIATNIPTQVLCPAILSIWVAGTTPEQIVDLWYLSNTLTVAR